MCFLFFILVPFTIYCVTYLPFLRLTNDGFIGIIKNQFEILWYHTSLEIMWYQTYLGGSASRWWQWLYNVRPLLYYAKEDGGAHQSILMLGNPLIVFAGLLAVLYCLADYIYGLFRRGEARVSARKTSLFLLVGYLSQLLPWALVRRTTFLYHYFPCMPFLILALIQVFRNYIATGKQLSAAFAVTSILLFIVFYPAISGIPYGEAYNGFLAAISWLIGYNQYLTFS